MQIKIPLNIDGSANTYQELRAQLKQLELSVHHAQKAIESAEKEGIEITENAFIDFGFPMLRSSLDIDQRDINKKKQETPIDLSSIPDDYYDELQSIELRIELS